MRCFYLPERILRPGINICLSNELRKHLLTVLRFQPGDKIEFFNGFGQVAEAVLKDDLSADLLEVFDHPPPPCSLALIQGLPKGDKLELVLQKGTELGVNEFCLVPMKRSIGQLKSNKKEQRLGRWGKIIQEAARQSRQYHLPKLEAPTSLSGALSTVQADLKLLLWEESAKPLEELLPQVAPQRIAVVVGPEGGISQGEADLARSAGYQAVSLGPRILRTETAGLAIMSILQYLYGDLASCQHG